MKRTLWALLVALPLTVFSQKPPVKFGDVSMDELKMTRYEKDTSASALVIADYGESFVEYHDERGFYIHFERLRRIKIFKKDGYSFADFSIPLYNVSNAGEKLNGLKAVTYNLEGGKKVETKMKNEGIFKEKVDNNLELVKFTLPNVKEGSVIEITYTVDSEFMFNFQDWEFQSTIPVKWSEYRARIPEYYQYQKYMQGYVPLEINEESNTPTFITITTKERTGNTVSKTTFETDQIQLTRNDYRWVAKDVPAFKEEPYMNNTVDYISKMNFELAYRQMPNRPIENYMNSWENLNTEFLESDRFGRVITGSGFLNSITRDLVEGLTEPTEKAAKIYSFVKENIEWDGKYRRSTEDLKKALAEKKGSSADVNLALVAMLQKAGLSSNPVLISTRNHGFIRKQYPLSSQFNYVICSVMLGEKLILLDATDRSLPMSILPERCLNGEGFVISKENSRWISIAPNFKSRTISNFDLALNEAGEMTGVVNIAREGYDAQRMRKSYSSKGEENYLNELASSHQWEVAKSTFENTSKIAEAVKEVHEVKMAEHVQAAGTVMYLNPLLMGKINENPFKLESRVYPVDFGSPFEQIFLGKFALPVGYTVEELPKPKLFLLPNGAAKYVYNVVQVGDKLQFTSQLSINRPLFSQEEYAGLREFYNQVVAKQNEQIVIKKK